jgi:hypothetical protein
MAYSTEQNQKPEDCPGTVCKNCAHRFEGRHCCHCGQSAGTRRIMTSEILTEALFSVVEVDNGFLFTAKELCLRPGKAIGRYLGGQRVPYYAPTSTCFSSAQLPHSSPAATTLSRKGTCHSVLLAGNPMFF